MTGPLTELLPPSLQVLTSLPRPNPTVISDAAGWEQTVALADRHRVTHRLAGCLASDEASVPEAVRSALQQRRVHLAAWHAQAFRPQLDELVTHLAGAGIRPTLLKGASITSTGLVPADQRPFADLDVLVRPDETDAARRVLRGLGYRTLGDPAMREWAVRHHFQDAPLVHPGRAVPVELHWHIIRRDDRRAFPSNSLRRVAVPGVPGADRLDDVDEVTHLSLHFLHDREQGRPGALGQLHDLAAAHARLDDAGWAELHRRAVSRGHPESVAAPVALAHLLLGRPLPPALPVATELAGHPRMADLAVRRVLSDRAPQFQMLVVTPNVAYRWPRVLARLLAHLRAPTPGRSRRDRWRQVARLVGRLAAAPRTSLDEVRLDRWAHGLQ